MKFTMLLVFILTGLNFCLAAVITVDNKHPYAGQYQTLQEAHDAAAPGDIIYVYPSMVPYDAITVTKQLTFYGVGFDITENIGEPFTPATSITGTMTFSSGAEGSWIEGFDGGFAVSIDANNITIKRNDLAWILANPNGSGSSIVQNKITGSIQAGIGYSNMYLSSASSIVILNNIMINPVQANIYHCIDGGSNLTIYNNIIKASFESSYAMVNISNSEIVNNIICYGWISVSNSSLRYNMYYSTNNDLTLGIGNIQNIDMNTVFVDYENNDFHLLPSSPAIGTGENGTDMGIYGGDAPYVDGGFPGLPSILQILAPTVGSQQSGLDIQFKAKSNNE